MQNENDIAMLLIEIEQLKAALKEYQDIGTVEEIQNIIKPIREAKNTNTAKDKLIKVLKETNLSSELKDEIVKWLNYKKFKYAIVGFQSLLTITEKKTADYGDKIIIDLIEECMANNYKGIIWDRLKNVKPLNPKGQPTKQYDAGNEYAFLDEKKPSSKKSIADVLDEVFADD